MSVSFDIRGQINVFSWRGASTEKRHPKHNGVCIQITPDTQLHRGTHSNPLTMLVTLLFILAELNSVTFIWNLLLFGYLSYRDPSLHIPILFRTTISQHYTSCSWHLLLNLAVFVTVTLLNKSTTLPNVLVGHHIWIPILEPVIDKLQWHPLLS